MIKTLTTFLLLSVFTISSAFAVGDPFSQAQFDKLLKDGKPILVMIHADWCTTCRSQDIFLKDLLKKPPYNNLRVLSVDFDTQKSVVQSFNVQWQSTLIVFKNGKEVDRSTADTNKDSVALMLRKAL